MPTLKEGWLLKKRPRGHQIRKWQKRWCVLESKSLYYYKNQGESENQGLIPLLEISAVNFFENKKEGCRFDIQVTNSRVYAFMASTKTEALGWVVAIQSAINTPEIRAAKQASEENTSTPDGPSPKASPAKTRQPCFTIAVNKARGVLPGEQEKSVNLFCTVDVMKGTEVLARRRTQVVPCSENPQWNADFPLHSDSRLKREQQWSALVLHITLYKQKRSDIAVAEASIELKTVVQEGQKKVKWFRLEKKQKGEKAKVLGQVQLGILIQSVQYLAHYVFSQFGRDYSELKQIDLTSTWGYNSPIPLVLIQMRNYLFTNGGLDIVGVFRLAPSSAECHLVREALNQDKFEGCKDANCLAHLIKVWYRDLPVKILDCLDQGKISSCEDEKQAWSLVEEIREPQRSLLLWLLDLCVAVNSKSSINKMDSANLAMIFGPNLLTTKISTDMSPKITPRGMQSALNSLGNSLSTLNGGNGTNGSSSSSSSSTASSTASSSLPGESPVKSPPSSPSPTAAGGRHQRSPSKTESLLVRNSYASKFVELALKERIDRLTKAGKKLEEMDQKQEGPVYVAKEGSEVLSLLDGGEDLVSPVPVSEDDEKGLSGSGVGERLNKLKNSDSMSSIGSMSDTDDDKVDLSSMRSLMKRDISGSTRSLFDVPDEEVEEADEDIKNEESSPITTAKRKLHIDDSAGGPNLIRVTSTDGPLPPNELVHALQAQRGIQHTNNNNLIPSSSNPNLTSPFKDGASPLKDIDALTSIMGWKASDFEVKKELFPSEGEVKETDGIIHDEEYYNKKIENLEKQLEDSILKFEDLISKPYVSSYSAPTPSKSTSSSQRSDSPSKSKIQPKILEF